MLIDLELGPAGFCAVHIPRTAGVAIAKAVAPWLSSHALIDTIDRHRTAWSIRQLLGAAVWGNLYRFAVLRHPRDVIASDYRLTRANAALLDTGHHFADKWRVRLERFRREPDLGAFLRREWYTVVKPGRGLWGTWCEGPEGEDLGIELVPYPELRARWPALAEAIGLEHTATARHGPPRRPCPFEPPFPCPVCHLPQVNAGPGPYVHWPGALAAEVDRYFARDVELLGQYTRRDASA
jgi:hypothetical protein